MYVRVSVLCYQSRSNILNDNFVVRQERESVSSPTWWRLYESYNHNILNNTLSHQKFMLGNTAIACNATCHAIRNGLAWHQNSLCRSIASTMMSWRRYEYHRRCIITRCCVKVMISQVIIRRLSHDHTFTTTTTTTTTTSVRVNVRWIG